MIIALQSINKLENSPKNTSISFNLSPAIPTVKNTDRYRQQILETKFTRLREVANLTETSSQFQANETKCTSNGIIIIRDRSLDEIELDIDFKCLQFDR